MAGHGRDEEFSNERGSGRGTGLEEGREGLVGGEEGGAGWR